jgi:hypothetical protein
MLKKNRKWLSNLRYYLMSEGGIVSKPVPELEVAAMIVDVLPPDSSVVKEEGGGGDQP